MSWTYIYEKMFGYTNDIGKRYMEDYTSTKKKLRHESFGFECDIYSLPWTHIYKKRSLAIEMTLEKDT